jgi:radical SAM superfamily enzyme YgiQ (UPF0313 family)
MSNLGYQFLLRELLLQRQETFDRAFALPAGTGALLPAYKVDKVPRSCVRRLPLASFPVHLVCLSFESDQLHLLRYLRDAGLCLRPEQRRQGQPLIVAGGAAVSGNPCVALAWADAVVVGDGEPVIAALCERLAHYGTGRWDRRESLASLRQLEGVLTKESLDGRWPLGRTTAAVLDEQPAWSVLLARRAAFGNSLLCELTRGCGQGCRFCSTCYGQQPVRTLGRAALRSILAQVDPQPDMRVGLVGASLADHPEIVSIGRDLQDLGLSFSTSSLRLDRLSTSTLLTLAGGGGRTLTFAPEAGSERLRGIIGKPLSEAKLDQMLQDVAKQLQNEIKLYFMVGLPGETEQDIRALEDLLTRARSTFQRAGRAGALKFAVSPFVPKPGTPFQWAAFAEVRELEMKLRRLRRRARALGLRFTAESARAAEVEALLSRGDLAVGEALVGFIAREHERAGAGAFRVAFRGSLAGLNQPQVPAAPLPWDCLRPAVAKDRLRRQYEAALADMSR